MEHFVTIFDSLFLPQGIALHLSLVRQEVEHTLWVICVDDDAYAVLSELRLPNVKPLALSSLETPELLSIKPGRTRAEYCWTLTPFAPRFVFETDPEVMCVTYIDADLWFRKHPRAIFEEFQQSRKSVLITEHAYAAEHDHSATSGRFCVQFISFLRNSSEPVRLWWEQRCVEWCYARVEDGKFGDQKYLDDWLERFPQYVHVLQHPELALAPWNASRFPYGNSIFWHFHGLRILKKRSGYAIYPGQHPLPQTTFDQVYRVYFLDIREAIQMLQSAGHAPAAQISLRAFHFFQPIVKSLARKLKTHALNLLPR